MYLGKQIQLAQHHDLGLRVQIVNAQTENIFDSMLQGLFLFIALYLLCHVGKINVSDDAAYTLQSFVIIL